MDFVNFSATMISSLQTVFEILVKSPEQMILATGWSDITKAIVLAVVDTFTLGLTDVSVLGLMIGTGVVVYISVTVWTWFLKAIPIA